MSSTDLERLRAATDLRALNSVLTELMSEQRHRSALKEENLSEVLSLVVSRALSSGEGRVLGTAVLGRLAAAMAERQSEILCHSDKLLDVRPISLGCLADGSEMYYAATTLRRSKAEWVAAYCIDEAVGLEAAENARTELLTIAMERLGSVESLLDQVVAALGPVRAIDSQSSRFRRAKRLTESIRKSVDAWPGDNGSRGGAALAALTSGIVEAPSSEDDWETVWAIVDDSLAIAVTLVQRRFSRGLAATTYEAMAICRKRFGAANWAVFLKNSSMVATVRLHLLEAVLILARQARTDDRFRAIVRGVYESDRIARTEIGDHLATARDLDPEVSRWWVTGVQASNRHEGVDQEVDSSVDQLVGELLVEVELAKEPLGILTDRAVPFLEIADATIAASLRRLVSGLTEAFRLARQVARLRRLKTAGLLSAEIEYNPSQHQLIGERLVGARSVVVVRDGVLKEFAGRVKMVVKPLVEPVR